MNTRIRITLDMDTEFIKQLKANINLSNIEKKQEDGKKLTAIQTLGLISCYEARGSTNEQIHSLIPNEWRSHIHVISDERKVFDEKGKEIKIP